MMDLKRLTDVELKAKLKEMSIQERHSLTVFLRHLMEFEERGLGRKSRQGSSYVYCIEELRLSAGEAFRRIQAAHLAERFPEVLDLLEDGRLNLTTVGVLAPHVNQATAAFLFKEAMGKSKREVEFLVAGLAPKPVPRDVVRVAPEGQPAPKIGEEETSTQPSLPAAPERISVLTQDTVRIYFSASRELLEKIERAKALLRHKFPFAEISDVVGEGLDALLLRRDPDLKLAGAAEREVLPGRRRIPQFVKDEVWRRDSGRCAYVGEDGSRCGTTSWLEYDHIVPFTKGGSSGDATNIQLLCRAHNQLKADS